MNTTDKINNIAEFDNCFLDPLVLNMSKNFSKILDALFEKIPSNKASQFIVKIQENIPITFTEKEYDLIVCELLTYILLEKKLHLKAKEYDSAVDPNVVISLAASKCSSEITNKIALNAQTNIGINVINASSKIICINISKKFIELLKENNNG